MTDTDLVVAAKLGDRDAFGDLIRRHHRLACRIALDLVPDRHLADDAVQEAAAGAWRHMASYRPEQTAFTTWHGAIVRNAAITVYRRWSRDRRVASLDAMVDGGHEDPQDRTADPAAGLKADESEAWVARQFARLTDAERPVAEAVFRDGLSYRAAGERTGLSLKAVKCRMAVARKKLARELAPVGA